jgi:hypothetical protein
MTIMLLNALNVTVLFLRKEKQSHKFSLFRYSGINFTFIAGTFCTCYLVLHMLKGLYSRFKNGIFS